MPQLNAETAAKVEQAEDGFKLLDPHIAIVKLTEDVIVKEGKKGPYWQWEFETVEGSEVGAGRKWRHRTSLSEAAFFKLKETFSAFGVPTSTNTETLVGKMVRAEITVETIGDGTRKGQLTNNISSLLPMNDEDGKPGFVGVTGKAPVQAPADAVSGGSTDEPLF
jgi:hypothetical protein